MKSESQKFRDSALKRIKEYEEFLELCGITPLAGSELEFHFSPQSSPNYRKFSHIHEFENSPLVETIKREETLRNVGEIVLGKGPNSKTWKYPRERYPSTIVRATESAKRIVQQGDKYGMDINFGEQGDAKRIRSLQSNISLWKTSDKSPLFINTPVPGELLNVPNELTQYCAESLVEAQQALSALVSPDEASFRRYKDKKAAFGVARGKEDKSTAALRDNSIGISPFVNSAPSDNKMDKPKRTQTSLYFEDRLASSEAEPALAMLITLGGIVNGVKKYMIQNGFFDEGGNPDPDKFKKFINSSEFSNSMSTTQGRTISNIPTSHTVAVPQNSNDALGNMQGNDVAIEIMGEEFHRAFCDEYKKKASLGVGR